MSIGLILTSELRHLEDAIVATPQIRPNGDVVQTVPGHSAMPAVCVTPNWRRSVS
jgi:hypothetical protein